MTELPTFCIIVPHYEHLEALTAYLPALLDSGLPVLVVDDGSSAATRQGLRDLCARNAGVELIENEGNVGKGAAMLSGFRHALARGYSHGICVDADGQHEAADLGRLQRVAAAHPDCVISGLPQFGPDIPAVRLYGRMITNGLARLEAGSLAIRDAMCGFRCYPLAPVIAVCEGYRVRYRMVFDPEILVRCAWRGVFTRHVPTRVRYPAGGVSHFRMFRDNVEMTLMHTRLILGALARSPRWLADALGRRVGREGAGQ